MPPTLLLLLLALRLPLPGSAFAGRTELDFGKSWRWHRGDDPAGPGLGSGALSGFQPRSHCTNMQHRMEWSPQGDKSAGYPAGVTSCGIACSYDDACTAFVAGGGTCQHGFQDTVCTGLPPPSPPPAPPGQCDPLRLIHQSSHAACTANTSFGCVVGREEMYVTNGCSGTFNCSGHSVRCVSNMDTRTNCSCTKTLRSPKASLASVGGFMQRGPTAAFQRNFSFAQNDFDDQNWRSATLPHDPLINQTFDPRAGEGSGFVPRQVVWYRKEFALPDELRGQHIFLRFDGAFQFSEVYLNGAHLQDHTTGYVSWTCRLDNATTLTQGKNVLAIRVDPSFGSGHWYEGGGINRPITLVATPKLHFVEGGIFPDPNSDGTALRVSAEVEDLSGASGSHQANFILCNSAGAVVASVEHTISTVPGSTSYSSVVLKPAAKLETWSPQTPVLYTLTARLGKDEVNLTTAVRVLDWKAKKAKINGQPIELQGFSHHPSFAGMGAMTNPRLGLFLSQTAKALGVNFWRMSHNPYEDTLYEILTTVGVMCWDENRNFGSSHAQEYHDMIKAHRHHAAIQIWGLCNEGQCGVENGTAAAVFMDVKNSLDPSRPQNGNMVGGQTYNFRHVDIITESGTAELNGWHQQFPDMPISTGEHGFGNNHLLFSRSETDRQLERLGPNVSDVFSGLLQTGGKGWSNLRPKQTVPFLLSSHGLGMWAMMDYYGEAWMGWPTVVKSRGHLDLAGFPRSTAWWFRTNFLANMDPRVSNATRPLVGGDWQIQVRALTPCQFFASTPFVDVIADGVSRGRHIVDPEYGLVDLRDGSSAWPPVVGPTPCKISLLREDSSGACKMGTTFGCDDGIEGMWVDQGCRGEFLCNGKNTTCACIGSQGWCSNRHNCSCNQLACHSTAKNVTVIALDGNGAAVGRHTLLASGSAVKLELVIDVPSISTGTGSALFLDGQDVAFVRAQLVDEAGTVSRDSDTNISWTVTSGPIHVVGVGSGAIANHQPVQGSTYESWQGLGRCVVQVTLDCTGRHRDLAKRIDLGAEATAYAETCPTEDAVLTAKTDRFSATIRIPLSGDLKDHPLEVAKATKVLEYSYFDEVQP